jgi:hypothetical protein
MKSLSTTVIVLIVIVGGASFFGGMKYQQSKTPQFQGQFPGGQFPGGGAMRGTGQNGQRTGGQGFRPVTGEIIEKDSSSITVKLTDGSSKIVLISDKTAINKAAEVSKDELKTGEKVGVFGTENPDGSVTAQNIQLNPRLQNMPGRIPR